MAETLPLLTFVLVAVLFAFTVSLFRKKIDISPFDLRLEVLQDNLDRLERGLREEIARNREALAAESRALREEVVHSLTMLGDSVSQEMAEMHAAERAVREEMTASQGAALKLVSDSVLGSLTRQSGEIGAAHRSLREEVSTSLKSLGDSLVMQITALSGVVDTRLRSLQEENGARLEQMRQTVDEKLQGTLEKRLGDSFRLVSERLEQVYKGLGEMQNLATGVGDLKKVLTNVKTRGTWGEVQLGNLLEQVLTPDQYGQNVATTGTRERVEFAIKLPGRDDPESIVWLPVDAKFPQEDYQRLVDASEQADPEAVEAAVRQLEARVKASAKEISQKYLDPPHTTDFAILYLPTEGLYAEVLRRPGLADALQRECRVVVAGPMTLTALLNSLQMGFRTLAIERRSSEVWKVLGAVKTEFQKYGDVLEKVQRKLDEASKTVESAAVRTRAIKRKLKDVEAPPESSSPALLPPPEDADEELERMIEG